MKRLTVKQIDGTYHIYDNNVIRKANCCDENNKNWFSLYEGNAIDKLGEYEDLEEQGRLLVLPCKVGDKLYLLQENNRKHEVVEVEVDRFEYAKYRVPRLEIYFTNASGFETCLLDGTLNEGVFLTKAKAEKALAEMGE